MRALPSLYASIFALSAAFAARAQTPPVPGPDVGGGAAAEAADSVVIVANRGPEPLDKVGQSVSVLTLKQIQDDQETVLSDVLARTPGVTVTRNGGVGQTTGLNIRGAASDQTLVLIDGVKLDDPSAPGGGFDFANLLVGDVARLEVLRGPQSTLYGSQAIGGVVNIVTAGPAAPFQADLQLEGGSYATAYAKGAVGGLSGPVSWRLAGSDYATNGVSAFDQRLGGREADGNRNQAVSGRVGYQIGPDVSLDLRGLYVHSRTQFDGFSTPTFAFGDDSEYGVTDQAVAYAGLNFGLLGGRLNNRVAVQYSANARRDYDPADAPVTKTFDGLGTNARVEYQGAYALAPGWRAVFGAQHEQADITTSAPAFDAPGARPLQANVRAESGYGQLQAEPIKGLSLTGGARYDSQSSFGGHVTGQASAAWSLNDGGTILRASWGQGFKAPSLYELYSPYGVAGLKPEQADGWDAGVEQRLWDRRVDLQATYFSRDTRNLISFSNCLSTSQPLCANGRFGYYANVQSSSARGVEVSGAARPAAGLEITANYTFTEAEDRSSGSAAYGKLLARIPRHMANAELSYTWPIKLTTAVAVRYAGDSYDDAANTVLLRAYTLVDLRAAYALSPKLEVYGRIENLADTAYETTYRYGTLGRAAYIGMRARF